MPRIANGGATRVDDRIDGMPIAQASDDLPRPPTGPRHWPTWLGLGLMWIAARLPWSLQRGLGAAIGAVALRLAGERRRAARINLALCFPELDDPTRDVLLRRSFHDFGIGLLLWLSGLALAWRAWRFSDAVAREHARPAMLALVVTVFPFNTHLAFYSTFWGGFTLLLAALYAGSLLAGRVTDTAMTSPPADA